MTGPWASSEAAEVWKQGAARRAETLALATERMFEAAGLRPGMHVLDVAAGTGDQTLLAARVIGADGSILASDISASMLGVAEQAARDAGLTNVRTLVSDASTLEVPDAHFDAGICRFGLMFVPDLHQALTRIHRALKPRAKFAALVWSSEERNPWMGVQLGALREMDRLPPPGTSMLRALSLSEPGMVERAFSEAGFREAQSEAVPTPRIFATIAETVAVMRSTSPAQGELTRRLSEVEREHYETELQERLGRFAQPDGSVSIPGEAILVWGLH